MRAWVSIHGPSSSAEEKSTWRAWTLVMDISMKGRRERWVPGRVRASSSTTPYSHGPPAGCGRLSADHRGASQSGFSNSCRGQSRSSHDSIVTRSIQSRPSRHLRRVRVLARPASAQPLFALPSHVLPGLPSLQTANPLCEHRPPCLVLGTAQCFDDASMF